MFCCDFELVENIESSTGDTGHSLGRITRVVALTPQTTRASGSTEIYVSTHHAVSVLQTLLKHGAGVNSTRQNALEIGGKMRVLLPEGGEMAWTHTEKHNIGDRVRLGQEDNIKMRVLLFHVIEFRTGVLKQRVTDTGHDAALKWPFQFPPETAKMDIKPYLKVERGVFIRSLADIRALERATLPPLNEIISNPATYIGPNGIFKLPRNFVQLNWPVLTSQNVRRAMERTKSKKSSSHDKMEIDVESDE